MDNIVVLAEDIQYVLEVYSKGRFESCLKV